MFELVSLKVSSLDKDSRRTIHTCVKKAFQNVTSDTIDENGKKFVAFKRGRGKYYLSQLAFTIFHSLHLLCFTVSVYKTLNLSCKLLF